MLKNDDTCYMIDNNGRLSKGIVAEVNIISEKEILYKVFLPNIKGEDSTFPFKMVSNIHAFSLEDMKDYLIDLHFKSVYELEKETDLKLRDLDILSKEGDY